MTPKQEEEAIFWCSLLSEILFEELGRKEVCQKLRKLSEEEVVFPSGESKKPPITTLKRKFKKYKKGGFNAMARKPRNDRGVPRTSSIEVIETAIAAKKEQPTRSPLMINHILDVEHGEQIPRSTMYRHLKDAGATRMKLGVTKQKVRKRWTCQQTNEMWAGDFEYGPYVLINGVPVQSYLSAFIDVHSRYIVAARYYVRQDFDVLADTMVRGFDVHGVPRHVYVDNGKVYHTNTLKKVCFHLGINLLHRPVRDPAPGGIIERFFNTAQGQFESEVRASDILTLERLNEGFTAWLDVVHHQTKNSDTKQTPSERYKDGFTALRKADMEAVLESFLQYDKRTVNKTFSDIRLNNHYYKVAPKLRGDRLVVRYDQRDTSNEILLYSLNDEYLGKGILHNREQGGPPPEKPTQTELRFNVLNMIIEKHNAKNAATTNDIDYSALQKPTGWTFDSFAVCMSTLLGRRGGISSFHADELTTLKEVYDAHPTMTRTLLKKAFSQAEHCTVASIIHALQEQSKKNITDKNNKEN